MEKIGIDVHTVATQVCVLTETGEYEERRIRTERGSLTEFFSKRPKARVLLEAATESEWVARHLESLGHEVIVADPGFARCTPTAAARSRPTAATRAHSAMPVTWAHKVPLIARATRVGSCASTWRRARYSCRCARAQSPFVAPSCVETAFESPLAPP